MTNNSSLLQTKIKVLELLDDNANEETIDKFITDQGFTVDQIKNFKIDKKQGVSLFERFRMGLAPNEASEEKTMQKLYPESVKMGNNFAIYDDKTQGAKMFNPSGFDFGDVAEFSGRAITSLPINIGGAYVGAKYAPTPVGKVIGGIIGSGVGESTGGEVADRIFQGTGGEIDRTLGQHASTRAFDFALGSVSQFITPYVLKALKAPFSGMKKTTQKESLNNIKIFEEANITPRSLGIMSEGGNFGIIKDLETILGNIPVAKDQIAKAGQQMQKDMGASITRTSNYLVKDPVPVNSLTLGNIVKDGIENATIRFNTKSTSLYNEAFDLIDGSTFMTPNTFIKKLNEIGKPSGIKITKKVTKKMAKEDPSLTVGDTIVVGRKTSELQSKEISKIRNEILEKLADDDLTFADLRNYRTLIGKKINSPNLLTDASYADWKQLYGSLSEDLKVMLKETNNQAYYKFMRADNYFKAGNKRFEEVLQPIKNVNQDKVLNFLLTNSKDGSLYINGLKKSLKPDEFGYVQKSIIDKLGRIKPSSGLNFDDAPVEELFNSKNFLDNWNKLDGKAKDFLFTSKKYKGLRQDLDRLATIASKIAKSKTFENPVKTQGSMVGQLAYAGVVTGAAWAGMWNVMLTGTMLYGGAEALTNPKLVKWLVKGTDIAETEGVDAFIKHLGKASVVFAGTQPELQNWATQFADTLAGQTDQKKEK